MYGYMIYQPKQVWKFFLTAIRFQWQITNLPPKQKMMFHFHDSAVKSFTTQGIAKHSWQIPMITQIDPKMIQGSLASAVF